jgi:predicted deacylase
METPDIERWRAGNTGTAGLWRFESGEAGREVLVTALVHGNELCGAWAVKAALEAGLRPRRGALVFAFCNLGAFPAQRATEQDLNRVWGDLGWRDRPKTAEQRRALELLPHAERADWLLDLHSMHHPGPPLVLTGMPRRHEALALELGTPALVVADAGHAEGRRLRDHGRFGADEDDGSRALLVECGAHDDPASSGVALDVLARFLVAAGSLDGGDIPPAWRQPLPPRQQVLEVTEAVTALPGDPPRFAGGWATGQCIERAGTLLGWNGGRPFRTPYDGCTLIMPSLRHARPGGTLMRLARPR